MIELHRNYGAMTTAREFWGGNNGFITVALQMDDATAELPIGADYEAAKTAHEAGTATEAQLVRMSNAERNLFRLAQAVGQRAVVVAVSSLETLIVTTDATLGADVDAWEANSAVTGNVLAFGSAGTTDTDFAAGKPVFVVTFLIERADVFTTQGARPGATYNDSVDPTQELADNLAAVQYGSTTAEFDPAGGTVAGALVAAEAVGVKVFDALPVLK